MSAVAAFVLAAAAAIGGPAVSVTLAPKPTAPGQTEIARIDVTLRFDGVNTAAGAPLLRIPLEASTIPTVATAIERVAAQDAAGPLTLTMRDVTSPVTAARDAEAGGPAREWLANRAVSGAITVRYSVPAMHDRSGPPFGLRNDSGAVSGAGQMFLLMPPGDARYRTSLAWDLTALPSGARGLSSFGEGRVEVAEPLTTNDLRMSFYMAGRIESWPRQVPASGFFATWQGQPPFDTPPVMQWTARLYDRYAAFFRQKSPPPYGVFLRFNPFNPGGGVGLRHSFVATYGVAGGAGSDPEDLRITMAHEMFHTFQPFIQQPAGLASSWFGEGLATLYMLRLPLRFGAIPPDAFLRELNEHAGRYYTSTKTTVPNSEVASKFWLDTRVRTLAYDRGMLYFADLDAQLRRRSGGKRSLDDLMFAMLERNARAEPTTNADWQALLEGELGAAAVTAFRAFLNGAMPVPPSDAFGPCFRRTTRPLRRFEPGFDDTAPRVPTRRITGLVAGSAAAEAGLRDGDEIVSMAPPFDILQGRQSMLLTITVRRDGATVPITYLPRGETVSAYQWERVPGVADSACAL